MNWFRRFLPLSGIDEAKHARPIYFSQGYAAFHVPKDGHAWKRLGV